MREAPSAHGAAEDPGRLARTAEQLAEEVRLLRMSLDELRDDVVWAARQVLAAGDSIAPGQLRRQYDPLAPDATANGRSASVPEDAESAEYVTYCCEEPNLQWNGDPDAPGIACENCGYVIAELGSVAIWRAEADDHVGTDPSNEPEQKQGSLF